MALLAEFELLHLGIVSPDSIHIECSKYLLSRAGSTRVCCKPEVSVQASKMDSRPLKVPEDLLSICKVKLPVTCFAWLAQLCAAEACLLHPFLFHASAVQSWPWTLETVPPVRLLASELGCAALRPEHGQYAPGTITRICIRK